MLIKYPLNAGQSSWHIVVNKKRQNLCTLGVYILVMEEGKKGKVIIQCFWDWYALWTKSRQGRKTDWILGQVCNFSWVVRESVTQIVTFETPQTHKFRIKKEPIVCQTGLVSHYTHLGCTQNDILMCNSGCEIMKFPAVGAGLEQ